MLVFPFLQLLFSFVARDPVIFLNRARKLDAVAVDERNVIIEQLDIFFLDGSLELVNFAF